MDMFDFDDIIQYHTRNLYELFYKRKGQVKEYPLAIRTKTGKKRKRTPEEQKEAIREKQRRYYWRNLEKVRERNREKSRRYRLKKKQESK